MLASTIFTLAGLVSLSTAGYVLEDDYEPSSFFSMFDFFTGGDPTHGYVTYVNQATAQQQGMINTNGPIYMGVDHTNVASGSGRSSVRITSKKTYNHGLIVLDAGHMPGGVCGTWPAFWTVGPNWPASGEIDIIEGVNSQNTNSMTLHTGAGCSITNNGLFSGVLGTTNCNTNAPGQATNAGCQINTPSTASFGTGFNGGQGGVYATEWSSESINIWFFPRSAIPSDLSSGSPDPTTWGSPTASFAGGCEIDNFFMNQQIVFDTTFCGDWAGNVWGTDPVCSAKAATCQDYVQNNPSAFTDAYWSVNSLKVYQSNGATTPSVQSGSPPSVSIPATVGSSLPTASALTGLSIPVRTSFATEPIPISIVSSETQSFGASALTGLSIPVSTPAGGEPTSASGAPPTSSFGGHHSHGDFSFSGHSAAAGIVSTPSVAALEEASGTDAVVVSTVDTAAPTASDSFSAATTSSPASSSLESVAAAPSTTPGAFFPIATTTPSTVLPKPTTDESSSAPEPTTAPTASVSTSYTQDESGHWHPHYITVSALEWNQFPDFNETQTRGTGWRAKRRDHLHKHMGRHGHQKGHF